MYPGAAQRPQLLLTLPRVARRKPWLHVAGMTVQLGHAVADFRVQHAKETLDADLLEMGFTPPVAVELREVAGGRIAPDRHSTTPGARHENREDPPGVLAGGAG